MIGTLTGMVYYALGVLSPNYFYLSGFNLLNPLATIAAALLLERTMATARASAAHPGS